MQQKKMMKLLYRLILLVRGGLIFLVASCSYDVLQGPNQYEAAAKNFSKLSKQKTTPESIRSWLNADPTAAKINYVSLLIIQKIKTARSNELRKKYTQLYLDIYYRITSSEFGIMKNSSYNKEGNLFLSSEQIDIKKIYSRTYEERVNLHRTVDNLDARQEFILLGEGMGMNRAHR